MKKPINTMRRKVIEDSKPERDAAQAANSQAESLDGIAGKLGEVQSASELVAETIENKGNQIISGLANIQAGTEIVAEATEGTQQEVRKLNDVANRISEKLGMLTHMLEQKLTARDPSGNGPGDSTGSQNASTALSIVAEKLPEIKTNGDEIREALEKLIPNDLPTPDSDFLPPNDPAPEPLPPTPPEPAPGQPGSPPPGENAVLEKLDKLIKTTKEGFKSSLGFADKITSMLFKYTVTAAVEAAKLAALILTIVLAIDLIKIHFEYWTKLFNTNFTKFSEKAGEWAPLLEGIAVAVNEVKKAFETGDFSGLAIAIIKGIGTTIVNLGELLILGISKMVAAIFRAFGKDDKADAIEGDALRTFVNHTGAKLNDKDQETLARYETKQINDDAAPIEKYKAMDAGSRGVAMQYGNVTQEELEKADKGEYNPLEKLSPEDQLKAVKARNEAEASIIRFNKYVEEVDPNDPANKRSVDAAYKEVSDNMKSSDLAKAPLLEKMIKDQFEAANAKYAKFQADGAKISAESVKDNADSQTVNRIEKAKKAGTDQNSNTQSAGNVTQINNVNKTNRTVYNMPPQTSTAAPGMVNSGKIN